CCSPTKNSARRARAFMLAPMFRRLGSATYGHWDALGFSTATWAMPITPESRPRAMPLVRAATTQVRPPPFFANTSGAPGNLLPAIASARKASVNRYAWSVLAAGFHLGKWAALGWNGTPRRCVSNNFLPLQAAGLV